MNKNDKIIRIKIMAEITRLFRDPCDSEEEIQKTNITNLVILGVILVVLEHIFAIIIILSFLFSK